MGNFIGLVIESDGSSKLYFLGVADYEFEVLKKWHIKNSNSLALDSAGKRLTLRSSKLCISWVLYGKSQPLRNLTLWICNFGAL